MIDILDSASATGDYFFVPESRTYTVTYSGTFDGATLSLEVLAEDASLNTEPVTVPDSSKTEAFVGRIHLDEGLPVRAAITSAGASTALSVVLV